MYIYKDSYKYDQTMKQSGPTGFKPIPNPKRICVAFIKQSEKETQDKRTCLYEQFVSIQILKNTNNIEFF